MTEDNNDKFYCHFLILNTIVIVPIHRAAIILDGEQESMSPQTNCKNVMLGVGGLRSHILPGNSISCNFSTL
jgi:hypothetical protein